MKTLIKISCFFFFGIISSYAQNSSISGKVTSNGEPLPFVNIYLKNTKLGTATNENGFFNLKIITNGTYIIVASSVGYETKSAKIVLTENEKITKNFNLNENSSLDEIVISGTLKPVTKSNSPVPVEIYSKTFFKKNPTPSIFESLQNVNGVRPQLNCNVCNTGDIHINGLEGPYTFVLIDGMPIVSGLSTVYGLTGIPQALIERVEVVKGPASTLYGSEAVGGIINIITKKPINAPILSTDILSSSWGEVNTDIGLRYKLSEKTQGLLGVNYFNYQNRIDNNKDGFTDLTLQNRISVFNKINIKRKSNKVFTIAVRYVYEDRWGGETDWERKFRGTNIKYGESIYTNRWETFGTYELPTSENISFQFSANGHYQDSFYGTDAYDAEQIIGFGQFVYNKQIAEKHDLLLGLAYRYTFYDDTTFATFEDDGITNKPSITYLPGIFLQDEIALNKQNKLLLGARLDYNSLHGSIFSPRLNYKWNSKDNSDIFRASIGNGFRVANVFTEDHAALTGARKVEFDGELDPETSWNANLNYVKKIYPKNSLVTLDFSAFYTYFDNRILPDYETDPNKIILSENTSIKYFGDKNPLGEAMTFEFGSRKYTFEVAGVAEKFPYQRTMSFSVLVNFDQLKQVDTNVNLTDWARFLDATFIQLDDPSAIANITQNVQQYVTLQNEVRKDYPATSFRFFPWTDLYQKGDDMRNTITGSTDGIGTLVLSIIAGFILVLAIFNYINIAIVSATKRLKEIGVRKVMGSTRKSLVFQFLAENVFLTLIALVLGFILGVTVLIPGFDQMFDIGMEFDIAQPSLWIFLLVLVVFTGLASGAYPALYISNFSAIHIFRGRLKFGGKNKMTKVFLTFQYILACIAVVGGIMFTQNTAFQKNQDWGYNEETTLSANIFPATEVMQLMAAMESNPNIESIAPSKDHLSRRSGRMEIQLLEKDFDIVTLSVAPEYIETMQLEVIEGRSFEKGREADFQNVLVNERMAKILNPQGALGERFKSDTLNFAVIGIIKDFHQQNFSEAIDPMIIKLSPEDEYAFVSMRVKPGTTVSTYEAMEEKWAELFPEKPFNGFYQEATLERYFQEMDGHGKLMRIVASMCIILSCLGLYGLVSLNVASRTKEFSIRKALGAGLKNLAFVINKQFVVFLAVALILGLPISYVLMNSLFETVYEVHKPITIVPFAIAFVIVVVMVVSTVSSQVKKVMTTSPTEGLRSE